jgi:beta-1,4-N-acetylglucosaminyltransferase
VINQLLFSLHPLIYTHNTTHYAETMTSTKLCFLTVGATASFSALIEAAVSPAFLAALEAQGYTELSVQYGQDGKSLFEKCKAAAQSSSPKVKVTGFDLDKLGLGKHMRRAKGGSSKESDEGVVISHAGKSCSFTLSQPLQIAKEYV